MTTAELGHKQDLLRAHLARLQKVLVAYSGGVDSAVLMAEAHEVLGEDAIACTAVSPSLSQRELEAASTLAREQGWSHELIETHEVSRPEYARNDPDRCYWCKTELFEVLGPLAALRGASVAVGTNVDDLSDHRPGQRAGREHRAETPLADAGLTKAEVREIARLRGLPVADKPASPCLASRFAYGVEVTAEGLRRIEGAEEAVRALGFYELRVRDHGDLARIEVPRSEIPRAAELHDELTGALKACGYVYVTLDLTGFRSGAMNEVLSPRFRTSR